MNLAEMRARLGVIVDKLNEFKNVEDYTDANLTEINELNDEYEVVKNKIEAKEKIENVLNISKKGTRKVAPTATIVSPQQNDIINKKVLAKTGGFEEAGSFFKAVVNASNGEFHPNFKNTAFEKNGEDGGFLIPEDFRSEIQQKIEGDESLLARTAQFKTGSNHLTLPTNETAPWDGNGIQAFWEGEGSNYKESKDKFGLKTWRLHKLTALVPVSDELLEDSTAMEGWINRMAPAAIMHKINHALINGSGAGKPKGILNSGFTIDVAKEVGQLADTIVYENIAKMDARLMGDGVFIAHAQIKEKLRLLKDDAGNPIYMNGGQFPNAAAKPFDTLLGRPIIYMMGAMPAVGDRGDIILANMDYYISAIRSGIKQAVSTHVYFDRDLTAFKFSFRIGGQCPYEAPVTTENGGYQMSGFVVLEDRA